MVPNRGHYQFSKGIRMVILAVVVAMITVFAVISLVYLNVSIVEDNWSAGEARITGARVAAYAALLVISYAGFMVSLGGTL